LGCHNPIFIDVTKLYRPALKEGKKSSYSGPWWDLRRRNSSFGLLERQPLTQVH
jgi:hypothetical protein